MKILAQTKLHLQQYGLTLNSLYARQRSGRLPRILANSIPKAGTNLLMRALYLNPPLRRAWLRTQVDNEVTRLGPVLAHLRPGQFLVGHIKFSQACTQLLQQAAVKHLLMVRDPRAIAVSNAHYISAIDRQHRLHAYFASLPDQEARIKASLFGIEGALLADGKASLSLLKHLEGYLSWQHSGVCLIVRFEDLIGCQGGGSEERQFQTLTDIAQFLGLDNQEASLKNIAGQLFSRESRTFRKGLVDGWQEGLSEELLALMTDVLHEPLLALGYR